VTVDLPLRAYPEALATPPGAPGAESATAVAAALAAALVAVGDSGGTSPPKSRRALPIPRM